MTSLSPFMGLQVLPLSPTPPGDGGRAISNDLRSLVSWNPKSTWNNTRVPAASDDSASDFYPGSLWSTNATPPQLFLCTNNTLGSAIWVPVVLNNPTVTLAQKLCVGGTTANDTVEIDGTSPTLRLANGGSASSFMQIQDTGTGRCRIIKTAQTGTSEIDIDPVPTDGSSPSLFRFFRSVTTTGQAAFQIFKGDGSATTNCQIAGNDASYVCANNSNFGVGTPSPAGLFSVGSGSPFQVSSAGVVSKYSGVATAARGTPAAIAVANLTGQSAAIGATTLYAVPASVTGFYRISYVATITTAATSSCTLGGTTGLQVRYTNASDSVVKTTIPTTPVVSSTNATGTSISGSLLVYAKTGAIQYLMGYTSSGATAMVYDLNIVVEML